MHVLVRMINWSIFSLRIKAFTALQNELLLPSKTDTAYMHLRIVSSVQTANLVRSKFPMWKYWKV
jgi:hypothetical protein